MLDAPLTFERDLRTPFAEPVWPETVTPVLFSETMARDLHRLLVTAYAKGEGEVASFSNWWPGVCTDPEYDAELIFVAQAANGPLVGLAHCWNSGFLKDLAVAPGWRRAGIGTALILRSFQALSNRYHDTVSLKVRTDNLAAIRLYKRLGMSPVRA